MKRWFAVDLDGTLAEYYGWDAGKIGAPIPKMVGRIQKWLQDGEEVRTYTARVATRTPGVVRAIEDWCSEHIGVVLPITCSKDYGMIECWDDRAVQVIPNTGERVDGGDRVSNLGELVIMTHRAMHKEWCAYHYTEHEKVVCTCFPNAEVNAIKESRAK